MCVEQIDVEEKLLSSKETTHHSSVFTRFDQKSLLSMSVNIACLKST